MCGVVGPVGLLSSKAAMAGGAGIAARNKAVEILQQRKDELVNAMVHETGAKPSWCAFNVKTGTCIEFVMEGAGT